MVELRSPKPSVACSSRVSPAKTHFNGVFLFCNLLPFSFSFSFLFFPRLFNSSIFKLYFTARFLLCYSLHFAAHV